MRIKHRSERGTLLQSWNAGLYVPGLLFTFSFGYGVCKGVGGYKMTAVTWVSAWVRAVPRLSTTECYKTRIMFPGTIICISNTVLSDVTPFLNTKIGKFTIDLGIIGLDFTTEIWCHGTGYFLVSHYPKSWKTFTSWRRFVPREYFIGTHNCSATQQALT